MAIKATVTRGKQFVPGEELSIAKLNMVASPQVDVSCEDNTITKGMLQTTLQTRLLNVCDYGADPTGNTSSTAAFQSAVAAATAAGGGIIRVPAGTFLLTRAAGVSGQDPVNNYAVSIAASNIHFVGDGRGVTVLKQGSVEITMLLFSGALKNVGIDGITFERWGTGGYPDHSLFSSMTSAPGTFVMFVGTLASLMTGVCVSNCTFHNVVTVAIQLGYVKGVNISRCRFLYYDGQTSSPEHGYGPQCAIFSGSNKVYDVTVTGNEFDGKVGATQKSDGGAEGFVWLSKGGNFSVTGNVIRNHCIEAVSFCAGPVTITGNSFSTVVGDDSSCAALIFPDTSDPAYIEAPDFVFSNNVVNGNYDSASAYPGTGSNGVIMAKSYMKFPYNAQIHGNIFRKVRFVVQATAARVLSVDSNTVETVQNLVQVLNMEADTPPVQLLNVSNNLCYDVKNNCVMVDGCLGKVGRISGNILWRGTSCNHVNAASGAYILDCRGNLCLDPSGAEEEGQFYPAATQLVPSGAQYSSGGQYTISTAVIGALVVFTKGASDTSAVSNGITYTETAEFIAKSGTIVLNGTANALVTATVAQYPRILRTLGRDFYAFRPPWNPADGYRLGDRVWSVTPGDGRGASWVANAENASRGVLVPNAGGQNAEDVCRIFDPTQGATALVFAPHVPGMYIRLVHVEICILGSTVWAGGTLTKIRFRSGVSGSYNTIAEVALSKFSTITANKLAPADITWSASDSGGFGGAAGLQATGAIELIGLDGSNNAAATTSGAKLMVKATILYEAKTS